MQKPGVQPSSYRAADLGSQLPPRRWRLMLGCELMAELSFESYETPWISVSVRAQPGLAPFMRHFSDPDGWADDEMIDAMLVEAER